MYDLNGEQECGCQIVGLPLTPIMDGALRTAASVTDNAVLEYQISLVQISQNLMRRFVRHSKVIPTILSRIIL